MRNKKAKLTAICGFAAALSVVLMLLTTVIPVFMYVLPIASGLIILFVSEISDKKWAWGVYFTTAFLSLLLLTDKEAALTYTLFFGYYPLIRVFFEKFKAPLAWLFKIIIFNSSAVLIGWLGVVLFGASGEEYEEFGRWTIPILLLMANIVFVLYELMLKKYVFFITRFGVKTARKIR